MDGRMYEYDPQAQGYKSKTSSRTGSHNCNLQSGRYCTVDGELPSLISTKLILKGHPCPSLHALCVHPPSQVRYIKPDLKLCEYT